jgi:uncharacterized protein
MSGRCTGRLARYGLVLALCVAGAVGPTSAQTAPRGFLWRVDGGGRVGWLVGSLHMLTPDAFPLPTAMTQAFSTSDTLVEEADPDELTSPNFSASVLAKAMYPGGQSLEQQVSPETFRLVSERAAAVGLPIEVVRRMKPWMVATTLQALTLSAGGFDPALGLDVYFHRQRGGTNKRFVALETGDQQLAFLEQAAEGLGEAMIRESVQSATREVAAATEVAAAWRAGNTAALERLVLETLRDAPRAYDVLIVQRNRRWLQPVRSCLDTTACFVVVGAAHLVGPEGLIAMLGAQGYRITQQ